MRVVVVSQPLVVPLLSESHLHAVLLKFGKMIEKINNGCCFSVLWLTSTYNTDFLSQERVRFMQCYVQKKHYTFHSVSRKAILCVCDCRSCVVHAPEDCLGPDIRTSTYVETGEGLDSIVSCNVVPKLGRFGDIIALSKEPRGVNTRTLVVVHVPEVRLA